MSDALISDVEEHMAKLAALDSNVYGTFSEAVESGKLEFVSDDFYTYQFSFLIYDLSCFCLDLHCPDGKFLKC